jgi:hypothetical protein
VRYGGINEAEFITTGMDIDYIINSLADFYANSHRSRLNTELVSQNHSFCSALEAHNSNYYIIEGLHFSYKKRQRIEGTVKEACFPRLRISHLTIFEHRMKYSNEITPFLLVKDSD